MTCIEESDLQHLISEVLWNLTQEEQEKLTKNDQKKSPRNLYSICDAIIVVKWDT